MCVEAVRACPDQASGAPAPSLRGSFVNQTRRFGYDGGDAGFRQLCPLRHWCICPQASLGPSGPSFIVEASAEALT